ncbi:FAD-binding oxidoreductase [Candidatus Bathyarchaeota archaeon]|nr:FAD-binding oxidoreductase [Candidatus Bathyarchaeota archaeon]
MVQTADTVVVGAGIIGCSIAYNLANMGASRIVVLEKEKAIGQGSSGRSAGGIRAQFASEINIKFSLESMKILDQFEQEVGEDVEFKHMGYLFLVSSPQMLDVFEKASEIQRKLGMVIDFVSRQEIKKLYPHIYAEDLLGGFFHQQAGCTDPDLICAAYYRGARKLGVDFRFETEAVGFEIDKGRVNAVITSQGKISAPLIINASGPYAQTVGRLAGLDIPALPYRRMIAVTAPFPAVDAGVPMTIDTSTGLYFRKELQGILMGESDKNEPPSFRTDINWDFWETIIEHAVQRVPRLSEAKIPRRNSWAGLYCNTPDKHAVLGEAPGLQGFFNAVGFCGHGVMHAPAAGKCVAETILKGKSQTIDLSPLSLSRFENGREGLVEAVSF